MKPEVQFSLKDPTSSSEKWLQLFEPRSTILIDMKTTQANKLWPGETEPALVSLGSGFWVRDQSGS